MFNVRIEWFSLRLGDSVVQGLSVTIDVRALIHRVKWRSGVWNLEIAK